MAKKKKIEEPINNAKLMPIYIMSAIIPLIVYMKFIKLEGILYKTWKGFEFFGDFFNYYKSIGIILTAVFALVMLLLRDRRERPELKKQTEFIPAVVYLFFVIISTFLSEYILVSINGFTERYEGMPVLVSYIFICFYTSITVTREAEAKRILTVLGISCVIIGIIGTFQYFGMDIFQSEWGMKLILPSAYQQYAKDMKFLYSEKMVYGTLYNPNFAGSYASMLLLISIGLFFHVKNMKHKIIAGLLFFGSAVILWIGSMSRAGIVGGLLGLIVFFALQFKNIIKNWKYPVLVILCFAALGFTLNSFSGGRITQEFDKINPIKEFERLAQLGEKFYVEEIKTVNKGIAIKTNTEALRIEIDDSNDNSDNNKDNENDIGNDNNSDSDNGYENDNGGIVFYDENGNSIEGDYNEGVYTFTEEPYKKYKLLTVEHGVDYIINISGYQFNIRYTDQGFQLLTATGETLIIKNAEEVLSKKGMEAFGSGRGFIWSRTIPMIKNTIFKGYGPDTYAIYFPQWDVAGKINGLNDPTTVVDKPHNWYLQIAINTGLLSLLGLIAFIFMYLLKTMKIHFKSNVKQELVLQSAIFSAIISYCMAGFFNDSVVSVAPVFWVLLGLGIAMNKSAYKKVAAK